MHDNFPERDSLILFVDVIDSSTFSSILGSQSYINKVLRFQNSFEKIAKQYFIAEDFKQSSNSYIECRSNGDEGILFVIDTAQKPEDLIHNAIRFCYDLKARLKIFDKEDEEKSPHGIDLACGIHYGRVGLVTENEKEKETVQKLISYAINYAKRVESSARLGCFSKIMLSKEASSIVTRYYPIITCKISSSMKGIYANDDVYEIQSIFLPSRIPLDKEDDELFCTYLCPGNPKYIDDMFLREPWLKNFTLSFLQSMAEDKTGPSNSTRYLALAEEIVFGNINETDPLILYARAHNYKGSGNPTRSISYLKRIMSEYPEFFYAHILFLNICAECSANTAIISKDVIYIRDMAAEFVEKYKHLLSPSEIDSWNKLIEKLSG